MQAFSNRHRPVQAVSRLISDELGPPQPGSEVEGTPAWPMSEPEQDAQRPAGKTGVKGYCGALLWQLHERHCSQSMTRAHAALRVI